MSDRMESAASNLNPEQAVELTLLVELEARWENLRKTPLHAQDGASETYDLRGIQKAYEDFHSKLVAYNRRYTSHHVPELLLNTPSRLAAWCGSMRRLYLSVENDRRVQCPVHLLQKAHRWANRISLRLNKPFARPTPPSTVRAAIQDLEALEQWCAELASAAPSPASP